MFKFIMDRDLIDPPVDLVELHLSHNQRTIANSGLKLFVLIYV